MTKTQEQILADLIQVWEPQGNIEASHTIIESVGGGLFTLDAQTNPSEWARGIGLFCEEDIRDALKEQLLELKAKANPRRLKRPSVVLLASNPASKVVEVGPPAWTKDAEQILQKLEGDQESEEFELALLVGEVTAFEDDQAERLLSALGRYIASKRFTLDEETTVNVCSAVRKYALNMSLNTLNEYSAWLEPSETGSVRSPVELELVKGILWRLSYEPIDSRGPFDRAIEVLTEISDSYTSPRVIVQENFSSIAICALSSLILLHSLLGQPESAKQVADKAKSTRREWIVDLVGNQIDESADAISDHDAELANAVSQVLTWLKG